MSRFNYREQASIRFDPSAYTSQQAQLRADWARVVLQAQRDRVRANEERLARIAVERSKATEEARAFEAALRDKLLRNPDGCDLTDREYEAIFSDDMILLGPFESIPRAWPTRDDQSVMPLEWIYRYCSPAFVGSISKYCYCDIHVSIKHKRTMKMIRALRATDVEVAKELVKSLPLVDVKGQLLTWAFAAYDPTCKSCPNHGESFCRITAYFVQAAGGMSPTNASDFDGSELRDWLRGAGCEHCWSLVMPGDRGPRINSRDDVQEFVKAIGEEGCAGAGPGFAGRRVRLMARELALCKKPVTSTLGGLLLSRLLRSSIGGMQDLATEFRSAVLSGDAGAGGWSVLEIRNAKMLALCQGGLTSSRKTIAEFGGAAYNLPYDFVANRIGSTAAIAIASCLDLSQTCRTFYSRYPSLLVVYARQIAGKGESVLSEFVCEFDRAIARIQLPVRDEMHKTIDDVRATLGPSLWKRLLQDMLSTWHPNRGYLFSGSGKALRLLKKKKGKPPRVLAKDGYADELALELREVACEPLAMGRSEKFSPDSPLRLLDDHTCSLIFEHAFVK